MINFLDDTYKIYNTKQSEYTNNINKVIENISLNIKNQLNSFLIDE